MTGGQARVGQGGCNMGGLCHANLWRARGASFTVINISVHVFCVKFRNSAQKKRNIEEKNMKNFEKLRNERTKRRSKKKIENEMAILWKYA